MIYNRIVIMWNIGRGWGMMPKVINCLYENAKMIVITSILIISVVFFGFVYDKEYPVHYAFNGIKYQSNNMDSATPVQIKIDGVYKKGYFGNPHTFKGIMLIDGKQCYATYGFGNRGDQYAFNEYKMSQIESDSFKGFIVIEDMMKKININIFEPSESGDMHFSYGNGWLISGPCSNRDEAVALSKQLISKLHADVPLK